MLVHLQTTWTFLPLTRPELGEPNDALHVDGQGRLASQVSNSGQALREQMGSKLGYLLLFHQSSHLKRNTSALPPKLTRTPELFFGEIRTQ